MRGKLTLLSGVIVAGAVVVSAAASTATAKPKATKITCQSTVYYPTPTQPKGLAFAYLNCPKPGAESALGGAGRARRGVGSGGRRRR